MTPGTVTEVPNINKTKQTKTKKLSMECFGHILKKHTSAALQMYLMRFHHLRFRRKGTVLTRWMERLLDL